MAVSREKRENEEFDDEEFLTRKTDEKNATHSCNAVLGRSVLQEFFQSTKFYIFHRVKCENIG